MNDTMVTARMSKAKKDAGNRILSELGSSASQFINSAYDYLIQRGTSPFVSDAEQAVGVTRAQLADALAQVETMCLPSGNRFRAMTDDEIRRERLARHGFGGR